MQVIEFDKFNNIYGYFFIRAEPISFEPRIKDILITTIDGKVDGPKPPWEYLFQGKEFSVNTSPSTQKRKTGASNIYLFDVECDLDIIQSICDKEIGLALVQNMEGFVSWQSRLIQHINSHADNNNSINLGFEILRTYKIV